MLERTKAKFNDLLLACLVPLLAGCQGGGGSSASVGNLFANGSDTATGLASSGGDPSVIVGGASDAMATVYNPEPASLLLMGTGVAAMACYKRFKK